MTEEIGFEQGPKKETPNLGDPGQERMKEKAVNSVIQSEIKKEVKEEISPEPVWDSVPPELPQMIFHCGAKWVDCQAFELDEKETAVMTKHLSNIIGNPSSKLFSLFVILVVIVSKITACKNAIMNKLKPQKQQGTA